MAPVTCGLGAAGGCAVWVSTQPGNTCCNDLYTISLPTGTQAKSYVNEKLEPWEPSNGIIKTIKQHTQSEVMVWHCEVWLSWHRLSGWLDAATLCMGEKKTVITFTYLIIGAIKTQFNQKVYGLTFSDLRLWVPSAHRSGLRCLTWIGRRRTCYLAGESGNRPFRVRLTTILLHIHQAWVACLDDV